MFGSPKPYQWIATLGVQVERVRADGVRGEWITPRDARPGTVLYVHGGGFVSCSAATHRPITSALARLTGRRVLSVDYRLAPEHRCPASLDDVTAAYRWLLGTGVASRTVAVAGDSAGGNLALALGIRVRDEGLPAPACIVCFSPWTDLSATGASITGNDGRCAMFRPQNMAQFASAYLDGRPASDPVASPLHAPLQGLPPVLLQVGSTELLLDDSRRVHAAIQHARGASELEVYDGMFHCWQMLAGLVPEADAALRKAADFMQRHGPQEQSRVVSDEFRVLHDSRPITHDS